MYPKVKCSVLLIFAFLISALVSGCSKSDSVSHQNSSADYFSSELVSDVSHGDLRIYLEENIIRPEAEYIVAVYENKRDSTFMYGTHHHFEKLDDDGEWVEIPFWDNLGFLDIGLRIEEHDQVYQSFALTSFQEPISEGLYRVYINAFGEYLEFRIMDGGATPERKSDYPISDDYFDQINIPENDWQWVRMWNVIGYYGHQGFHITRFVPAKNGLVALLILPEGTTPEEATDETKCRLLVYDRKTATEYIIYSEPTVLRDSVEAEKDGFKIDVDGKTQTIHIKNGVLVYY